MVKEMAPYLAEWIEYHRLIGFDRLLLYANDIADNTRCVLDACARRDDVTRMPKDVGACHMEELPWLHKGQILDNPQQAIFEACRRYLVDRERNSGEVGSTWMLTSDVDDFLWFDRESARGPANAKDALSRLMYELSSGTARQGASRS